MGKCNAWALYRRAEACLNLHNYSAATRTIHRAMSAAEKEATSKNTTVAASFKKFVQLFDKIKQETSLNCDDLEVISIEMEVAAEKDLEEANKKEEVSLHRECYVTHFFVLDFICADDHVLY